MSTPGIGSTVIYYTDPALVPLPAVVVGTHDTWNTAWTDVYGDRAQPTTDQVWISSDIEGFVLCSEGTGAGQFSRISLALDLGTIDLGSVDLSAATATNVSVPDV
jgi:hypothetical protein